MKMRNIVMVATLLAVVSGGELSAQAKTRMLGKITHVKVTKHKVTGHTTKYAHIKLTGLKHDETAKAKANKHGNFVIKVKKNNLKKLNFKIKATKKGYKTRTYKYKAVKKASPVAEKPEKKPVTEHVITENHNQSNTSPSTNIVTHPNFPTLTKPNEPSKSKSELIKEKRKQLNEAKIAYYKLKHDSQKDQDDFSKLMDTVQDLQTDINMALKALSESTDKDKTQLNENLQKAEEALDKETSSDLYLKVTQRQEEIWKQLNLAEMKVSNLGDDLHNLDPSKPFEGTL